MDREKMVYTVNLGLVPYTRALELQQILHQKRVAGDIPDVLLLLEHPPVITVGKSGKDQNILFPEVVLQQNGITVEHINRGGDVTFHGPGQLVGYPIFHILSHSKGVKDFVFRMEEVFIHLLAKYYQIQSRRDVAYTGVWVDDSKITAMGFEIRKYVSMHGFAFNVTTDLTQFRWINPCGIIGKGVTSLAKLTGKPLSMNTVIDEVTASFQTVFSVEMKIIPPAQLFSMVGIKQP